jgi:hypothetical protein
MRFSRRKNQKHRLPVATRIANSVTPIISVRRRNAKQACKRHRAEQDGRDGQQRSNDLGDPLPKRFWQ